MIHRRKPTSRFFTFLLLITSALLFISASSQAADPVPVEVQKPEFANAEDVLSLSGTVTAEKNSLLSPRVAGLVERVNVDAGSRVKKGQILLHLDPALARHQLARSKAAVAQAVADRDEAARLVSEAERLRKQNHISASELANRKANLALKKAVLAAAQAEQANAEETLQRHDLPAPFSGVISDKMTEAGEWVDRGDTVLELVNLDVVRVDVKVPQERFQDITMETPVTIIADSFPQDKIKASINAIVPVSDPQARAFLVRVVISSKNLPLLPGTSATAQFAINSDKQQKLLIPRDALLLHPDGGYSVFVVTDNKAVRKQVEVGQFSQYGVSINNGLQASDLVVVRGNEVLRDQEPVKIVTP